MFDIDPFLLANTYRDKIKEYSKPYFEKNCEKIDKEMNELCSKIVDCATENMNNGNSIAILHDYIGAIIMKLESKKDIVLYEIMTKS